MCRSKALHSGDLRRDYSLHVRICLLGVKASQGKGQGETLNAITKHPYGYDREIETLRTKLQDQEKGKIPSKDFFKEILLMLVHGEYLRQVQKSFNINGSRSGH